MYTASDWYWVHADGRVFSSKSGVVVVTSDLGYAKWRNGGNSATGWPTNLSGVATDAALDEVLEAAGLQCRVSKNGLSHLIKQECARRIFAVASTNAQMNMTAFIASGAGEVSKPVFLQALAWVAAMRAASARMITAGDVAWTLDASWPICDPAVIAFALRF